MKSKSKTLGSAKVGKPHLGESCFTIIINESTYRIFDKSKADSILDAVDQHIMKDQSFTNWMTSFDPDGDDDTHFIPAILCAFNYISLEEFLEYSITGVTEQAEMDSNEKENEN